MSENEQVLTYEQLTELVKLFYMDDNPNREEIDQILNNWYTSPSSIPTSFEIIRSSNNESLRFFAAKCLRYFIINHIDSFSEENIEDMANLFSEFILENQNRVDSADTKYIMISLADLCGIFSQLIDSAIKTFPPDIFLYILGLLAEEAEEPYYHALYNADNHISDYINQFKDIIYQYLSEAPYSSLWAQSFQRAFHFFLKPIDCIPFLDKLEIMSQDETNYSSFIKIFIDSFGLDHSDEATYEFNTLIAQIAINFAINNPNFATFIWKTIFDFDPSFILSEDKIEFSEPIIELFLESIPNFNEDEDLKNAIEKFAEILSTPFNFIKYPDDLILKHILKFIEMLINGYNEKRSQIMAICIYCVNKFNNGQFLDEIKEFIVSQPITPAVFLLYRSQLFNVSDDEKSENDNDLIFQVIDYIFELSEVPVEAFVFLRGKVIFTSLIKPYIERFIQLCLNLLEEYTTDSIESLKTLSICHTEEISPYSYDLSVTLMPILPQLNFTDQATLIIFFFNIITPADTESLGMIRDLILQTCSSMIESSDIENFKVTIHFLKRLFSDFPSSNDLIKEFMCEMLPLIFHELTPIALEHEDIIQDNLCGLILSASNCIVFPDSEDAEERQQLFLATETYSEIFEWIFTIINQFLCSGHLTVLSVLKIQPTPEIIEIISHIEPNDHHEIITELFKYFQFISNSNSEKLWCIIPFEFIINFMNSDNTDVISSLLLFFRRLNNISIEIKSEIMQNIINRSATKDWIKKNYMLYEYIKTIAVLIGGNEDVFNLYCEHMASFFPYLENVKGKFFEQLWALSKVTKNKIEIINSYGYSNNIKDDLLNIIASAIIE